MQDIDSYSNFNSQHFKFHHSILLKLIEIKLLNFSLNPFFPFFIHDIYNHETHSKKFKQII